MKKDTGFIIGIAIIIIIAFIVLSSFFVVVSKTLKPGFKIVITFKTVVL